MKKRVGKRRAPKPKRSAAAIAKRRDPKAQTILWLLEGKRADDIAQLLRATYPDDNPSKLLRAATDHFATIAESDPLVIRGWCLEALREMYRRMVECGDYPSALRAIKELMAYARQCSPLESRDEKGPEPEPPASQASNLMPNVIAT